MTASDPHPAARSAAIDRQTYTFTDIAGLYQCSVRTVRRWDDRRLIPGRIQIGRLIRFHKKLVDEWLAAGGPSARRR